MPEIRPDIVKHILRKQGLKRYNISDEGLEKCTHVYRQRPDDPLLKLRRAKVEKIYKSKTATIEVTEIERVTCAFRLGIKNPDDLEDLDIKLTEVAYYRISEPDYRTRPESDGIYADKQLRKYFIETRDGWRLPLPNKEKYPDTTASLAGKWFSYHQTRNSDKEITTVKSEVDIFENGECKLTHGEIEDAEYKGVYHVDNNGDIVFIWDCMTDRFEERMVYRYNYPLGKFKMTGYWLGIDYRKILCSGKALLQQEDIDVEDAKIELDAQKDVSVSKKTTSLNSNISSVSKSNTWNIDLVGSSIQKFKAGDDVVITTTYLPAPRDIKKQIKIKAASLEEKDDDDKKPKVTFLFLKPDWHDLANIRFQHAVEAKDCSKEIKRQVNVFLKLGKKLAQKIKIEVREYKAWPFAMCYRFEDVIYYGLMLPHDYAGFSTMYMATPEDTQIWDELIDGIAKQYEHSTEVNELYSIEK